MKSPMKATWIVLSLSERSAMLVPPSLALQTDWDQEGAGGGACQWWEGGLWAENSSSSVGGLFWLQTLLYLWLNSTP